ncbi:Threonyl/alanyl tRNA synthetase [Phyllosticta citricarpa]|uniref:Threonyl/alanyl tRNA synthetase n=1 Tax=Phyllosticta paracitricarpa TaxID=2016321 RepID=A0ABR1NFB6_9PEZI
MGPSLGTQQQTKLLYQHDDTLTAHTTRILAVSRVSELPDSDKPPTKGCPVDEWVVETAETIFYVKGGGQPSDTGIMMRDEGRVSFAVSAVLHAATDGRVLHFGRFSDGIFGPGDVVHQNIDVDLRNLHSRIHDAGHIVSLAVRAVAEETHDLRIQDRKAQHYPGAAHVEFEGTIDGKYKDAIQAKVNAMLEQDLPVKVFWWTENEMREKCVFMPATMTAPEGELLRAVDIVGAGAYPCGGTHVASTKLCGKIVVRKISRSKGTSRISYEVQ